MCLWWAASQPCFTFQVCCPPKGYRQASGTLGHLCPRNMKEMVIVKWKWRSQARSLLSPLLPHFWMVLHPEVPYIYMYWGLSTCLFAVAPSGNLAMLWNIYYYLQLKNKKIKVHGREVTCPKCVGSLVGCCWSCWYVFGKFGRTLWCQACIYPAAWCLLA